MVEKYFLALDYDSADDATKIGLSAISNIEKKFGKDFVAKNVGVKINEDLVTGPIYEGLGALGKYGAGASIFVDKKIGHGYDTGERIIENLSKHLPVDFVTVSAALGTEILEKYVEIGKKFGIKIIAFTAHTKIHPDDVLRIYQRPVGDVIYNLAGIAADAGCDAVVLEGERLQEERIQKLPIKKLVTGIRIDSSDKGTQQRVTSLERLKENKEFVNYAVISSKYLTNFESLQQILDTLM